MEPTTEQPEINEELILLDLKCNTGEEVIRTLADPLIAKKWVKDGYLKAVLERETEYPTGLPTDGTAVAIPHTNSEYCLRSAMVTGILREPVPFGNMADPDELLPVRIVFLLAIKEPAFQVHWLKKLVSMLQKQGMLDKLVNSPSAHAATDLLREVL
jgi:galactitol PTS system EIIA component